MAGGFFRICPFPKKRACHYQPAALFRLDSTLFRLSKPADNAGCKL
jgi:hypothetical protein